MLTELVLLIIGLYCLFIYLTPKRPPNFPPGPETVYPLIGSGLALSKLGKSSYDTFRKLGELYGPISGIFLGGQPAIIINGYEASKEFYAVEEFSARPTMYTLNLRWGGRSLGVFFSNGRLWQEQRRFTIRHLRDFGFGKATMEGLIHEESEECIKSMSKALGESSVISIHDRFGVSMINILWAIVGGTRYSHEDKDFKKLLNTIQSSFRTGSARSPTLNIINAFPWVRHLPYFKRKFEAVNAGINAMIIVLLETIEEHQRTFDPSSEPRDLIDVYLKAMEESKDDPESTFFKDQLVQLCADLFSAGSETTSSSVAFAILHMIRNPDCQEKVHRELDGVVGRGRLPSLDDKPNLPYTFAVITESFRMSPVGPLSAPHMAAKDVQLMGYDVPIAYHLPPSQILINAVQHGQDRAYPAHNTWAMVNYTSVNMDKSYWGDPESFRPERFLDGEGQFIKGKLDHVHGFGAGKRQCLGEPLARISSFLLFTAIMQRFQFEKADDHQPMPTAEPVEGFTVSPKPFQAKVTARYSPNNMLDQDH